MLTDVLDVLIEKKRKEMLKAAQKHNLNFLHPEVLAKSQELDKYIYVHMEKKTKSKSQLPHA